MRLIASIVGKHRHTLIRNHCCCRAKMLAHAPPAHLALPAPERSARLLELRRTSGATCSFAAAAADPTRCSLHLLLTRPLWHQSGTAIPSQEGAERPTRSQASGQRLREV